MLLFGRFFRTLKRWLRPKPAVPGIAPLWRHLAAHGGMITYGGHLGVMVGRRGSERGCPAGWVFLALEDATPERVRDALEYTKRGRKAWPKKPNGTTPQ